MPMMTKATADKRFRVVAIMRFKQKAFLRTLGSSWISMKISWGPEAFWEVEPGDHGSSKHLTLFEQITREPRFRN